MKRVYWLILLLLISGSYRAFSQNLVYDANAEVRKVADFKGLDVQDGIAVYLSQGNTQAVAVSAGDERNVPKIKTEVRDGILKISVDAGFWNGWNWGDKKLKAYVTVTDLETLELSGGSVGKITDQLNIGSIKIDLNGGSILEGSLSGKELDLSLSGGSIAKLSGTVSSSAVQASGGSILKSYDLALDQLKVSASGGSIIAVTVNKEMNVEASGGSVINYKGSGVISSIDTSGGSILKKKDE